MDKDITQPLTPERTVNFRCPCGALLSLGLESGGRCDQCQREVSPRALQLELSRTIAIHPDSHDLSHRDFVLASEEGSDDLIGKSLGHFEIISPLGRGGMGNVYRAFDQSLKRYVAVKVLLSKDERRGPTELQVDRLLQEAVAQARVNHPNIVGIYYVGKHGPDPFLAMELIPGQTLAERLSQASLAFYDIVYVAWQISEALRFSHELDLMHGDIKPSNILIQDNNVIKLSDFGMARSASRAEPGAIGGTPNYLAPEVLEGGKPSIFSDMYALGVTLFEMTFGRRPITLSGSSVKEWSLSHSTSKIVFPQPWPEEIPRAWQTILLKLLEKDPARRYQSYEELSADLVRVAPAPNLPARVLPRMIAAGIDHLLVGMAFAVMLGVTAFLSRQVDVFLEGRPGGWWNYLNTDMPWYLQELSTIINTLLSALCFLPIVVYAIVVGYWKQSLGKLLMHIRVVNKFGLRPSARILMGRSVLNMAWLWAIGTMTLLPLDHFAEWLVPSIAIGMTVYSLIDLAYMGFLGNGSSLHDRLYETRVVIDTNQQ